MEERKNNEGANGHLRLRYFRPAIEPPEIHRKTSYEGAKVPSPSPEQLTFIGDHRRPYHATPVAIRVFAWVDLNHRPLGYEFQGNLI